MPSLAFTRIPGITKVHKVIADRRNCYILAERALYRLPLSRSNLAQDLPTYYTIADVATLCSETSSFADVVISGTRAWLATSCGLFRVASDIDVASLKNSSERAWHKIMLPESMTAVTRLLPISPTHREVDCATTARGGNLYIMSSTVSVYRTLVYRIAIDPESGNGVPLENESTVFPDYFTSRTKSYFISRGLYRNCMFTDGATWLLTQSRYAPEDAPITLELLPAALQSGIPLIGSMSTRLFDIAPHHRINEPIRDSARGSLLVHGDFGIYIQQ